MLYYSVDEDKRESVCGEAEPMLDHKYLPTYLWRQTAMRL
jgi:hypothetical protein